MDFRKQGEIMAKNEEKKEYLAKFIKEDWDIIDEASKKGNTMYSKIIRTGALKEAKKILREIEKGK